MTRVVKLTIFASALALASLGTSSFAAADKFPRPCIDCVPGNGVPNVGKDQNRGNQGGRQRRIEKRQGPKGLDQDHMTQRKFHSRNQPGGGDNGLNQGMPEQHVRKYHPDGRPGIGDNGPDQGTLDRHVRKYRPEGQSEVGDNEPDQGTLDRHVRKYRPEGQSEAGDNGPDQGMPDPRIRKYPPDDKIKQGGGDDVTIDQKRKRYAKRKWQFDPDRHERRRHRDKRFRFFFGGFWYPESYWDEFYDYYDDNYFETHGVSCREGAEIVAERFYRVRILDCYGSIFTYLGLRHGETFEIDLSALTGRILNAHEI